MAHAVEHVGGGGRRGEELGQEVVAARFEDDFIVNVGDVHDLCIRYIMFGKSRRCGGVWRAPIRRRIAYCLLLTMKML